MRILIVDDELPARTKLHRMLALEAAGRDHWALHMACDAREALALLGQFNPDVIFLDIQMPEVNGLELAASLPQPAPLVVFVTAYDEFAVRAFDAEAVDYLHKPYDQSRLHRALVRVQERLQLRTQLPQREPLTQASEHTARALQHLLVTERGVTRVVQVAHIAWLETADNYVVLHTPHGQPLLRQTLTHLLHNLGERFVRCHRRAAVQLCHVEAVHALDKGDCELLLHGGQRVPCSRQYRATVMQRLQAQGLGSPAHPG